MYVEAVFLRWLLTALPSCALAHMWWLETRIILVPMLRLASGSLAVLLRHHGPQWFCIRGECVLR